MIYKDYEFGLHAHRSDLPPISWNPDSKSSVNPHLLVCGASGSGKTTLLKDIAKHLARANKHIFIFDLKGDMIIEEDDGSVIGNYIEFTSWNSDYGVSPFEFDTGVPEKELQEIIDDNCNMTDAQRFKIQNCGPKVQVERIVEIIKKNFLPNMGTNQKDFFTYLFMDTYTYKGFKYDDVSTWLKELPSLEDTQDLLSRVLNVVSKKKKMSLDDVSGDYIGELKRNIVGLRSIKNRFIVQKNDQDIEEYITQNLENIKSVEVDIDNEDDIVQICKKYLSLKETMESSHKNYINFGMENISEDDIMSDFDWFKAHGLDLEKYISSGSASTLEKIASYINALVSAGTFHSKKPPVKPGLNVVNISGLDVPVQRFICDIWIGKVFKSCKIRGTYSERPNKSRGEKVDTYIIVDESKLISGSTKEKNDPYGFLSRIASESRSQGLGLVVGSQSASHFPPEFLRNFHTQVVLNTSVADQDIVKRSFNIDKEQLKYTQLGWGHGLIKIGQNFTPVKISYGQNLNEINKAS